MEIKRLVLGSADGDIDILYEDRADVKRLASFEAPSKEFRKAEHDLELELSGFIGKPVSLKSIAYKHDILEHSVKVAGFIGAVNDSVVKIQTEALTWHEDEGGKVIPMKGVSMDLIVAALSLNQQCIGYLKGERAQRNLFPKREEEPVAATM